MTSETGETAQGKTKWETTLNKETDPDVLKKCVLVENLPLFTGAPDVVFHFNLLGTVQNISFLSRKKNFRRACVVQMQNEEEVTKILNKTSHRIYISNSVVVKEYHGMGTYDDLLENSILLLVISGVSLKNGGVDLEDTSNLKTSKEISEYIEGILAEFQYNSIEVHMHGNYKSTGVVTVQFTNENQMNLVKEELE